MLALSVVIPAYNSSTTIRSTLDSVLPQLEAQDQVVVVNDGSTDTTQVILDEYRDEHQVQCLAQDNAGVSAARNIGVQQAAGDYI
ncbi:MAG TPA: glycosyltransferase, partial [Gammaproteobacteria bacterium]